MYPMFIAALFTIAEIWKQPKCLSIDQWIKKMQGVCVCVCVCVCVYLFIFIYNGILFSYKKDEVVLFATT